MYLSYAASLIVAALTINSVFAAEVAVHGRGYSHSCGYYSATAGDFNVTYLNQELRWGTQVYLRYGLNGEWSQQGTRVWQRAAEVEMSAISGYTWSGKVTVSLGSRGSAEAYDALAFVVRVVLPDGSQFFEKGSQGPQGYFMARLAPVFSMSFPCVDETHAKPEFQKLTPELVLF